MPFEINSYSITVTCSQDASIVFSCIAKRRPGSALSRDFDTSTDTSSGAEPGGMKLPAEGELTVIDTPQLQAQITAVLGVKGSIFFTGTATGMSAVYRNAWFTSYTPERCSSSLPTATIKFHSPEGAE